MRRLAERTDRLLDALTRKTSGGRFIAEVDGLRFVSIVLVALFHLLGFVAATRGLTVIQAAEQDWLAALLQHGHWGVQIFFVISGFVLGLPFANHYLRGGPRVSLTRYLRRRLTRLEPPYIVAMLGAAALLVVTGRWTLPALQPHLLASLLYVHNLAYGGGSVLNVVAWSLEIEVQFYLIAPLLGALAYRGGALRRRAGVVGLAALFAALQAWRGEGDALLRMSLPGQAQYFLMGLLLADLYVTDWQTPTSRARSWDLAWVASWPALLLAWQSPPALHVVLVPAAAAMLFAATLRGDFGRRVLGNRWVVTVGGMCYSIYLLHYILIAMVGRVFRGVGEGAPLWAAMALQVPLVLIPILVVCTVFFALVERPCMDPQWPQRAMSWLRLRWPGARRPAAVEAGVIEP